MEAAALPTAAARPVVRRILGHASDEDLVARVRAGDDGAFELLYDRHHRGLLGFCRHMLGSTEEAEDALQHAMLSAYRAMRADGRELHVKPWLYTIARNRCLSVLRARRDESAVHDDLVPTDGLAAEVDRRAELRELVADLARLPEEQRSALVLFELAGHDQDEIAEVLGVRREKVKALVFQARQNLLAARTARATPCEEIRAELSVASGAALRRGPLRRHVDGCEGCRAFEAGIRQQRAALAIALPVVPAAGLKDTVLGVIGATQASGAATAAGGAATVAVATTTAAGTGAGAGVSAAGGAAAAGVAGSAATPGVAGIAGLAAKGLAAKLAIAGAIAVSAGGTGYVAVDKLHVAGLDSAPAAREHDMSTTPAGGPASGGSGAPSGPDASGGPDQPGRRPATTGGHRQDGAMPGRGARRHGEPAATAPGRTKPERGPATPKKRESSQRHGTDAAEKAGRGRSAKGGGPGTPNGKANGRAGSKESPAPPPPDETATEAPAAPETPVAGEPTAPPTTVKAPAPKGRAGVKRTAATDEAG